MKHLACTCLFINIFTFSNSQGQSYKWPVPGKDPGKDPGESILYKPRDYIHDEFNSGSINNKRADPMSPLGTESSFIPPKKLDLNAELPLDGLFEQTLKQISGPMTPGEFETLLTPVLNSLRDSHTGINSIIPQACEAKGTTMPVYFGRMKDSLVIFRVLENEINYPDKGIAAINGIPVDTVIKRVVEFQTKAAANSQAGADGIIGGRKEFYTSVLFWSQFQYAFKPDQGDQFTVDFTDGSSGSSVVRSPGKNEKRVPAWNENFHPKSSI
jgi:hypothetical protein